MRSSDVACARETRRFWRQSCGGVRIWVVASEHTLAARLPRHTHKGDEIVGGSAADATVADATVTIAIKNPAFVVYGDFVEIE